MRALLLLPMFAIATAAQAGKVTRMGDGSLACVEGGAMVTGPSGTWTTQSPATVGADCSKSLKVADGGGRVEEWRKGQRVRVVTPADPAPRPNR